GNIARRLMRHGHSVAAFDRDAATVAALSKEGVEGAATIQEFVKGLEKPRAVWLMLPAGEVTERALGDVASQLAKGDVVIAGGNTFWKDDLRRAGMLERLGIDYVDVGTSGGVWGLERGYCLMVGGDQPVVHRPAPIFKALQ